MSSSFQSDMLACLPRLRRYAAYLTQTRDQADDLVQDTIARALDRQHQFVRGTSPISWLVSICRSIWLTQLRRDGYRRRADGGFQDTCHGAWANRAPTPGDEVGYLRCLLAEVVEEVERLPPHQRHLVARYATGQFCHNEEAARAGISPITARTRLYRGQARVRAAFEDQR